MHSCCAIGVSSDVGLLGRREAAHLTVDVALGTASRVASVAEAERAGVKVLCV